MKDSEFRWFPSKKSIVKIAFPLAAISFLLSDDSNIDFRKNTFDFRGYDSTSSLEIRGLEEKERLKEIGVDEIQDTFLEPPLKSDQILIPGPTATPIPTQTPESTPTPIPTPVFVEALDTVCNLRFWEKEDIPSSIYIPAVGNINEIELKGRDILDQSGYPNYIVPPRNIASATDNREHTIHIFGHSFDIVRGEFLPFSNIQYLNAGDYVILKNQKGEAFCFSVSNFALSGLVESRLGILGPFETPTIALQTSFWTPNLGYLLDPDKVNGKVGTDKPENLDQYLVFLAYARQLTSPLVP